MCSSRSRVPAWLHHSVRADMRRPITALLCCLCAIPASTKCPQRLASPEELRQAYDCMMASSNQACPEHLHRTGPTRKWPCCVWAATQQPSHELGAIQCEIARWLVEAARTRAPTPVTSALGVYSATLLPPSTAEVGIRSVCIPNRASYSRTPLGQGLRSPGSPGYEV